jgi:cytoskeleton protein RodZ
VASFGAQLRKEREQRGITLDEISQATKIGTRMLHALEEDQFDQLPGGIFNKGFVRAYAHCLGIDEEQAVADYLAATSTVPADAKPESTESIVAEVGAEAGHKPASRLPWGLFAIALLVAALAFVAWGFYARGAGQGSRAIARHDAVPSSTRDLAVASQAAQSPALTQPAPSKSSANPEAPKRPVPSAGNATLVARTSATPSSSETSSRLPPKTSPLVVRIKAREDCWISVSVDGEVTTQNTLTAQTEKTVRAQEEIIIKAGNVGALDFEFNGTELPAQGGYGEVKTLTFDSKGIHKAPSQPTPAGEIPNPQL